MTKIQLFYSSEDPDYTVTKRKCIRPDYCQGVRVAVDGGIDFFCEGCPVWVDCDKENALLNELEALNE